MGWFSYQGGCIIGGTIGFLYSIAYAIHAEQELKEIRKENALREAAEALSASNELPSKQA